MSNLPSPLQRIGSRLLRQDAFKTRVQDSGKPCVDFMTEAFFATEQKALSPPRGLHRRGTANKAPPRLISDQMINIFFQEWAPIFPVLHRPSFLNIYTNYMANPESVKDQHVIAGRYITEPFGSFYTLFVTSQSCFLEKRQLLAGDTCLAKFGNLREKQY